MNNPEYWKISAECVAAELSLQLTDEQLQDLAELLYDASQMESEATGQHSFTKNLMERTTPDTTEALKLLNTLYYSFVKAERRSNGDGSMEWQQPKEATEIFIKLRGIIESWG